MKKEIDWPEHLRKIPMDCIVLNNTMDSCCNITGNVWSILLFNEEMMNEMFNDKTRKVPQSEDEKIFIRLHNFECYDNGIAVMLAAAWLYDNRVMYKKIIIRKNGV